MKIKKNTCRVEKGSTVTKAHIGLDELGWKRLYSIVSFLEDQCGRRLSQSAIVRRMINLYFQWLHMLDDPQLQLEELRLLEQVEKSPGPKPQSNIQSNIQPNVEYTSDEYPRVRRKKAKRRTLDEAVTLAEVNAPRWEV